MRICVITDDAELRDAALVGFHPSDEAEFFADWQKALDSCDGCDLMFVDMLTTLLEPHKIEGYERFAEAKMSHPIASEIPLVLISPPTEYELDFIAGYPNFLIGNIRRPITEKIFRRASTWV